MCHPVHGVFVVQGQCAHDRVIVRLDVRIAGCTRRFFHQPFKRVKGQCVLTVVEGLNGTFMSGVMGCRGIRPLGVEVCWAEVTPSSTTRAGIGKDKLGMGSRACFQSYRRFGALLKGANLVFNANPWGFHTPNAGF